MTQPLILDTLRQDADRERQALRERVAYLDGRIATLDELIAHLQRVEPQEESADAPPAE